MFDFEKSGHIPEPVIRQILSRKFAQEVRRSRSKSRSRITNRSRSRSGSESGSRSRSRSRSGSRSRSRKRSRSRSQSKIRSRVRKEQEPLPQAGEVDEMLGEYRRLHTKSEPETPEEAAYIDYR